jgi:hypothetical protein
VPSVPTLSNGGIGSTHLSLDELMHCRPPIPAGGSPAGGCSVPIQPHCRRKKQQDMYDSRRPQPAPASPRALGPPLPIHSLLVWDRALRKFLRPGTRPRVADLPWCRGCCPCNSSAPRCGMLVEILYGQLRRWSNWIPPPPGGDRSKILLPRRHIFSRFHGAQICTGSNTNFLLEEQLRGGGVRGCIARPPILTREGPEFDHLGKSIKNNFRVAKKNAKAPPTLNSGRIQEFFESTS